MASAWHWVLQREKPGRPHNPLHLGKWTPKPRGEWRRKRVAQHSNNNPKKTYVQRMFPMFVRCLNFKFVTNMALTPWPSYIIIDHVGLARCKAMYLRENRFVCRCMGCAWDLPTLGMGLTYPGIILPVVFSEWHGHLSSLQKRHHLTNWQPELVLHTLVAWWFFTNPSVKKMQPSNFQIFPQPSGWTWTTIFELPAPSEVGVLPPIFLGWDLETWRSWKILLT